jgi:alkylated DNA nucleotide flippase Atl1
MGFNTGAWSGVLVAMVLFGQNLTAIALAAMAGVSSEARSSSQVLNATSMARTPMPIMIRRKVSIPLRQPVTRSAART